METGNNNTAFYSVPRFKKFKTVNITFLWKLAVEKYLVFKSNR